MPRLWRERSIAWAHLRRNWRCLSKLRLGNCLQHCIGEQALLECLLCHCWVLVLQSRPGACGGGTLQCVLCSLDQLIEKEENALQLQLQCRSSVQSALSAGVGGTIFTALRAPHHIGQQLLDVLGHMAHGRDNALVARGADAAAQIVERLQRIKDVHCAQAPRRRAACWHGVLREQRVQLLSRDQWPGRSAGWIALRWRAGARACIAHDDVARRLC